MNGEDLTEPSKFKHDGHGNPEIHPVTRQPTVTALRDVTSAWCIVNALNSVDASKDTDFEKKVSLGNLIQKIWDMKNNKAFDAPVDLSSDDLTYVRESLSVLRIDPFTSAQIDRILESPLAAADVVHIEPPVADSAEGSVVRVAGAWWPNAEEG